MQFGVIYLETWGSTQPCVAFSALNFDLVSLFLVEHTQQQILLHCISQLLTVIMIEGICLWSHVALSRAMNVCIHSLPLPLIAYEIIGFSKQISQRYRET
jgi:hypothetical protein